MVRAIGSVGIMLAAAVAGFLGGAFLNAPVGGAILGAMIAGIACIVYAIEEKQ